MKKTLCVRLCKTSLDHLLEPLNNRNHTALISDKTKRAGVAVVESGGP